MSTVDIVERDKVIDHLIKQRDKALAECDAAARDMRERCAKVADKYTVKAADDPEEIEAFTSGWVESAAFIAFDIRALLDTAINNVTTENNGVTEGGCSVIATNCATPEVK